MSLSTGIVSMKIFIIAPSQTGQLGTTWLDLGNRYIPDRKLPVITAALSGPILNEGWRDIFAVKTLGTTLSVWPSVQAVHFFNKSYGVTELWMISHFRYWVISYTLCSIQYRSDPRTGGVPRPDTRPPISGVESVTLPFGPFTSFHCIGT